MCSEFNLFGQHERLPTTWKTSSLAANKVTLTSPGRPAQLLARRGRQVGAGTHNNALNAQNEIQGSLSRHRPTGVVTPSTRALPTLLDRLKHSR